MRVVLPTVLAGSMIEVSDSVELLYALVATPSPSGQEEAAAAVLVDWMARHDFDSTIDGAGNAVGILDGGPAIDGTPAREIVLLGHIDTVPGLIPVRIQDGRLYGRGAVDAKGPLAAFAVAAAQTRPRQGWRITVIGAVEEEAVTSKGARYIVRRHEPAFAVIGEPSGWNRVTLGYKGRLLANLTVRRAMAHRSGGKISACELSVAFWNRVVDRVTELNVGHDKAWDQVLASLRRFSSTDDGLHETAQMELGFRLPLHVTPGELELALSELVDGVQLSFSGEEVAYRAGKDNRLVSSFLRAIRDQGGQPGFVLKTGTSDMNVVGPAWCCPIVAYGPGDSNLDHTPEESLELSEWERSVAIVAGMLNQLQSLPTRSGQTT